MLDCIVVGAGPSGSSTAYHLAKRGHSVLVIEKESLPRYKPCAGGISPAIQAWFDFDFSPVIARKINSLRYSWKLEDTVDIHLDAPQPFWIVDRAQFDQFLMEQAQKVGATLKEGTPVTGVEWKGDRWLVKTPQETFEAKYVVAADGAKGPMAKWLGFKESKSRKAAIVESSQAPQPETLANFEFGLVKNGYLWNFPKQENYSVAISSFKGGEGQDLNKILKEYAKGYGLDPNSLTFYEHPLSLWDGNQKLHGQNSLLVGEAASLVDPFSGEGIRPGIYSGMKAAEALAQAIAGNTKALETYTTEINDYWGEDFKWSQRLAAAFYQFPKIGYKVAAKRPGATQRMGLILCGELRYSEVVEYALKRLSSYLIPGRA